MRSLVPAVDTVAVLAAALTLGMALALVTMVRVLEPASLQYVRRRVGVGPLLGGALVGTLAVAMASVAAVGDVPERGTIAGVGFLASLGLHLLGLWLVALGVASAPAYVRVRLAARRNATAVDPGERVAVSGRARVADGTAETPFAGAAALCYEARIMERRGEGGDDEQETEPAGLGTGWVPERLTEDHTPFAVEDGTGRVRVDPAGADRLLDDQVVAASGGDAGRKQHVEATLEPDEPVAVVGTTAHDGDAGTVRVDADVVAARDLDALERELHRRAVRSLGEGAALALAGYVGLLLAAGTL